MRRLKLFGASLPKVQEEAIHYIGGFLNMMMKVRYLIRLANLVNIPS